MRTSKQFRWVQIGAAAAILFAFAEAAFAAPLPLTLTGPVAGHTVGPQSTSAPCIIAGTHCSNPDGFGYNDFTASGADSSYNMYSTTPTATVADGVQGTPYTVAQIEAVVGSTFVVAIDVNTTAAAGESLDLFEVYVGGALAYSYTGPTPIGGIANNGNGYGDWYLGIIDLSSFADGASVLFHAVWSGATDGAESFFLVSAPNGRVPEPGTAALLGLALGGLGLFRARRGRRGPG